MSPRYTWYMLTRNPAAPEIAYLGVFMALMLLTASVWPRLPRLNGDRRAYWTAAVLYFTLSMAVALVTGARQGSDRNYLIEPTLAAGMIIGLWAARAARAIEKRAWSMTRVIALGAAFSPLLTRLPIRYAQYGARERAVEAATCRYTPAAEEWIRSVPGPVLSLDPWLAFRAGVPNDLNDPIAYASYAINTAGPDVIARRVREHRYAGIITYESIEREQNVTGDIPLHWPALRQAVLDAYRPAGAFMDWHLYVPRE
jgi:hypothetical protein